MATELVSYDQLKAILKLDGATIADYPPLGIIRDSVSVRIEQFLGRVLAEQTLTEIISLEDSTRMINLSALPISSVTSAQFDDGFGNTTDLTWKSDFRVSNNYGLHTFMPWSNGDLSVTYTGGYATIPEDITRAALQQTVYEYENRDHMGAYSVSTDGGTVSVPELGLLKEVKANLMNYRHPKLWSV